MSIGEISLERGRLDGIDWQNRKQERMSAERFLVRSNHAPAGFGDCLRSFRGSSCRNYALALCRLGRWQDGVVELREVLRLDPDSADAANALYIAREQAKAQPGDVHKRP
jgi:hypothetical protein